jgi:hypothetical protein
MRRGDSDAVKIAGIRMRDAQQANILSGHRKHRGHGQLIRRQFQMAPIDKFQTALSENSIDKAKPNMLLPYNIRKVPPAPFPGAACQGAGLFDAAPANLQLQTTQTI